MLSYRLEFIPDRDSELYAAAPASAAVFVLRGAEGGGEPYLSKTSNLRRRLQRLLGPLVPPSKRLNLREFARSIRYRLTASPFEQTFAYYQQAKALFPARYRDMLRMRPPAILKVNLRNREQGTFSFRSRCSREIRDRGGF